MLDQVFQALNTSTFFVGIMMLLLNVGSRYIVHELADDDEEYRKFIIIRRFAVFAVCFIGTRDVVASIILTAGFIVLSTGLFRGKSKYAKEGMANPSLAERGVVVSSAGLY